MSENMGKLYADGEYVIHQGELGDCMYIVQSGEVEILQRSQGQEYCLAVLGPGDFFGEMALVERDVRNASARALGPAWVLTVEKKGFLQRVHQDPSLAFRILQKMSARIRDLDARLVRMGVSTLEEGLQQIRK